MLGISIYPEKQSKEEILNYIEKAANLGFKRIFSCLLSVQKPKEEIKKEFKEINAFAKKLGMMVVLDVNPRVFNELGVSYDDLSFFKELDAEGIRLDLGFDGKKEADMTYNPQNLKVEINISNENKYLDNILSYHPNTNNLISSHNFYPQMYTGLSLDFFTRITKKFKDNGIRTAAFITSKNAKVGPWPLSHGLCSLELCRNISPTAQAKFLYATGLIDDIIFGDAFASDDELKALSKINKNKLTFKLKQSSLTENSAIENAILFENPHFRRGDTNDYCVRSTQSRVKYKNEPFKPHTTKSKLKKGDVVICNDNYGQYKGELQIVLQDMDNYQEGKSVIGQIVDEEIILLDYLKPLERFAFEKE